MEVTGSNVGFYNHVFEDVLFSMLLLCWKGYDQSSSNAYWSLLDDIWLGLVCVGKFHVDWLGSYFACL